MLAGIFWGILSSAVFSKLILANNFLMNTIRESSSLYKDLALHFVTPDLIPKLFVKVINIQHLQAKS